jgi:hypothetical protein
LFIFPNTWLIHHICKKFTNCDRLFFFRQALKTDGHAGRSVCRTCNGSAPSDFGVNPLRLLLFVFEPISTGQLVQTPDQVQAFEANMHAGFFVPAEREIFGFAFPLLITNRLVDFGNGILRILGYAPAVQ